MHWFRQGGQRDAQVFFKEGGQRRVKIGMTLLQRFHIWRTAVQAIKINNKFGAGRQQVGGVFIFQFYDLWRRRQIAGQHSRMSQRAVEAVSLGIENQERLFHSG